MILLEGGQMSSESKGKVNSGFCLRGVKCLVKKRQGLGFNDFA